MAEDRGEAQSPPVDLARRELPLSELSPAPWVRIHRAKNEPCFYSEDAGNRFSSLGLGVLYLADAPVTAFWEIYWDDLGARAPNERRIARSKLNQRVVSSALLRRTLHVFDATNSHSLKAVSAPTSAFSGNYTRCQEWALALSEHASMPQGILYPSARHGGGRCLALFASRTECTDLAFASSATPLADSSEILRAVLAERVVVLDD
jgi:hypothetical protein